MLLWWECGHFVRRKYCAWYHFWACSAHISSYAFENVCECTQYLVNSSWVLLSYPFLLHSNTNTSGKLISVSCFGLMLITTTPLIFWQNCPYLGKSTFLVIVCSGPGLSCRFMISLFCIHSIYQRLNLVVSTLWAFMQPVFNIYLSASKRVLPSWKGQPAMQYVLAGGVL